MKRFEKSPLFGQRIVITRARDSGGAFRRMLKERGADVIEIPVIRIVPNPGSADWSAPIKDIDWLVFTSPNGVSHFFRLYLERNDIRSLTGIRFAVVGTSTAEALRAFDIKPDFQPSRFDSKTLADEWPHEADNTRVLFPCGNLAGTEVEQGLRARGCQVERREIYKTMPGVERNDSSVRIFLERGADWVVFCSSSAVENFSALGLAQSRAGMRFASIGSSTSAAMRRVGINVDYEAEESNLSALVRGIERLTKPAEPLG